MKKWISQPLRNVRYGIWSYMIALVGIYIGYESLLIYLLDNIFPREIDLRLDAVAELCSPSASCLSSLKGQLTQLPDLERGLCTIYHKKVSVMLLVPKSVLQNNRVCVLFIRFLITRIIFQ